jgi:hypothetical protein
MLRCVRCWCNVREVLGLTPARPILQAVEFFGSQYRSFGGREVEVSIKADR